MVQCRWLRGGRPFFAVALLVTIPGARPAAAQVAQADSPLVAIGQSFLRRLDAGQFDSAAAMISPAVPPGALGATQLRQIWGQLTSSAGDYIDAVPFRVATQDTLKLVELTGRFQRDTLIVRIVLMPDRTIGGLWFLPSEPDWQPPEYADRDAFDDIDVSIGEAPWMLRGTLTVPRADSSAPVVILVHGSGPHDRDETIGPNKPFKDLAWGLASRGIAVLRYEKRTRAYAGRLPADITVDDEVIDDALAAIRTARSHPRVDSTRVFLLGHSLGALLAPEIARRDGGLAGIILMAPPARAPWAVMRDQIDYIAGLEGTPDATKKALAAALDTLEMMQAGQLPDSTVVMGAPVSYYHDLARYDAVAGAMALDIPRLILHGGRDYQVGEADVRIWAEAFARRTDVPVIEYPTLNHLFMEGRGMATPAEYQQPGHVAAAVIDDIVEWIMVRR